MPIAMIIHGGAWNIPDSLVEAHVAGCRAALETGWAVLKTGASALDACEAAVRVLEDDPTFDAGTGSVLTSAGTVELDAALMDGRTLRYGAVANLRRLRNPISLARHVLEGPATFLAGEGAEQFAVACGLPLCDNHELITPRERHLWERWQAGQAQAPAENPPHTEVHVVGGHDTVGAIALDRMGNLVAANSTGGTPFKLPGRIGDTPLIGCGLYADGRVGAAVCTGWGEAITRVAMARRAIELLERGLPPQSAAEVAVRTLGRAVPGGNGGCIILTPQARIGLAWNTQRMAYAYQSEGAQAIWGC
ncbi:isoaspartyl peptidase/L-asparaginase family protein [Candidatus Viridilinea mediisalina]|uniref:Peptidase T n=1 Tax=Candidatus Viridilinea mediisalina TaxID=2024553 RepID=A0A2A6REI1_9CHLR|nr:isoaspartyl peptidase/L-asparaginase [Candidatus Viridilinea mediisalina]PDW01000.1 peptidase T [Candidatus Viridilinea mediisalina]